MLDVERNEGNRYRHIHVGPTLLYTRVEKLRIFLGVSPGAFNIGVHEPFS